MSTVVSGTKTRVFIAGDCWLKRGMAALEPMSVWNEPSPEVFIVNLEGAVPSGSVRPNRRALLPMDSARVPDLAIGRQNVCVLANNHVTDYGPQGLASTVLAARAAGFLTVGAGKSLAAAREPVIVKIGDRSLGILAYAGTAAYVGSIAATEGSPGVAPLDPEMIVSDVRRLAQRVDDMRVFLHWGCERIRYPDPQQRVLAKRFTAAGATAVIGTHPHVVQGWEFVRHTPIFYSLDTFVFPPIELSDGPVFHWDAKSREGLALKAEWESNWWVWTHIPYLVSCEGSPYVPTPRVRSALLMRFRALCMAFTSQYATTYARRLRREKLLRAVRRLRTMSWQERWKLLRRALAGLSLPLRR